MGTTIERLFCKKNWVSKSSGESDVDSEEEVEKFKAAQKKREQDKKRPIQARAKKMTKKANSRLK